MRIIDQPRCVDEGGLLLMGGVHSPGIGRGGGMLHCISVMTESRYKAKNALPPTSLTTTPHKQRGNLTPATPVFLCAVTLGGMALSGDGRFFLCNGV